MRRCAGAKNDARRRETVTGVIFYTSAGLRTAAA